MTPETAEMMEPQPARMGEISRIFGVFFEPKKAFADIAQRPGWVVPLTLVLLCMLGVSALIGQRIGWERVIKQQMENNTQMQRMPPEQRAQNEQIQLKMAPVIGFAAPVLVTVIGTIISAAVLLGITGLMSGGLRFKQVFAVVNYGRLPVIISSILTAIVIFLKNPDDFNLRNPLAFNLGAFMDPNGTSKFVYAIASSLDLFTFWTIFLIATGLKAAAGKKLSFAGALVAVAAPWVVIALLGATFAGAFS